MSVETENSMPNECEAMASHAGFWKSIADKVNELTGQRTMRHWRRATVFRFP